MLENEWLQKEWFETDYPLSKKERIALSTELTELRKWEKFNEAVGFTSDMADEVEDRICEIKAILEKDEARICEIEAALEADEDEEEFYSEFEHTPITL